MAVAQRHAAQVGLWTSRTPEGCPRGTWHGGQTVGLACPQGVGGVVVAITLLLVANRGFGPGRAGRGGGKG